MNTKELIEYIKKEDSGYKILEKLGCHGIKENENEIRCGLPNHTNITSVCLYKESMKVIVYSETHLNGDVVSFVMKMNNLSFGSANRFIHDIYGLEYTFNKNDKKEDKKFNPLAIFEKVKKKKMIEFDENQIATYDKIIGDSYPYLHELWIKEGITEKAKNTFDIRYSFYKNRIIIPIRYWQTGQVVAINSRTVIPQSDLLGIPKYKLTKNYQKNLNLYGLYENYAEIQNKGYVVVYESEKSVLKRYSRFDGTGVAIHGHSLSNEQISILISLNVDIVIAMDKDVALYEVREMCERIYKFRNVYYIFDFFSVLGSHDSPADTDNFYFNLLFEAKKLYDFEQHEEHILEMEELNKKYLTRR